MKPKFNILHRDYLKQAIPTFMNQCEGGSCGCTGKDIKPPDSFELGALAVMQGLDDIHYAPYHHLAKVDVLRAIQKRCQFLIDLEK